MEWRSSTRFFTQVRGLHRKFLFFRNGGNISISGDLGNVLDRRVSGERALPPLQ